MRNRNFLPASWESSAAAPAAANPRSEAGSGYSGHHSGRSWRALADRCRVGRSQTCPAEISAGVRPAIQDGPTVTVLDLVDDFRGSNADLERAEVFLVGLVGNFDLVRFLPVANDQLRRSRTAITLNTAISGESTVRVVCVPLTGAAPELLLFFNACKAQLLDC